MTVDDVDAAVAELRAKGAEIAIGRGGEVAMGRELQLREAPRTQCSEHEAVTSLTTLSPSNN